MAGSSIRICSLALFPILILLLLSFSFAWDWDTHRKLASDLLLPQFPACASEIENGSVAPDRDFKDTARHHCYSLGCPSNDSAFCPKKTTDCPAFAKGEEWKAKAENESGNCSAAYDLAVATHYFSDSFNPMHQLTGEDYEKCHAVYEDKIGEAVKRGKGIDVSVACAKPNQTFTFTSSDFAELEQKAAGKLALPITAPIQPAGNASAISAAPEAGTQDVRGVLGQFTLIIGILMVLSLALLAIVAAVIIYAVIFIIRKLLGR